MTVPPFSFRPSPLPHNRSATLVPPGPDGEQMARHLFQRAVTALQAGRPQDAEAAFRQVLILLPGHANSTRNLALLMRARGATQDGLLTLDRALRLDPSLAQAEDLPLSALFADDLTRAGQSGQPAWIEAVARAWVRWRPEDPQGHGALAMHLLAHNDGDGAARVLAAVPPQIAADPTLLHARGLIALRHGHPAEATRAVQAALTLAPAYADAQATLGLIAQRYRDGEGSEPAFRRALHLAPSRPVALLGLARLRVSEGRASEAATLILRVPPIIRHAPEQIGDLLSVLHHAPGLSPDLIRAERDAWSPPSGRWHPLSAAEAARHPATPRTIVYLADLTRPQIAALALPAMLAHREVAQARGGRVYILHTTPPDQPSLPLPKDIDPNTVISVSRPTATALQAALKELCPDILILATPTTLPQALVALTERQAPVQALWGDIFCSLGLKSMDALLTDRYHVPTEQDRHAMAEAPVCLPHGAYLFAPPDHAPDPGPPPCLTAPDGMVTFGSFNRLDKLHDALLVRWGRILSALPSARLILQAKALDRADLATATRARLARLGLPCNRIQLEGGRDRAGMMDLYTQVDIALDSDPWSGGLTVLESLWMGVPVVTLAGRPLCGRHAVSHLTRAGLLDWITASAEAYVSRAVTAAQDRNGLVNIRGSLRSRIAALPCCDPVAFARQLDDACLGLWSDHRAGQRPGTRDWAWPGPDPQAPSPQGA